MDGIFDPIFIKPIVNHSNLQALTVVTSLFVVGFLLTSFWRISKPTSRTSKKLATLARIIIVLSGTLLRFYGLDFGFPNTLHCDECSKLYIVLRMVTSNNFDPNYFLHPSLLLYFSYALTKLFSLLGPFDPETPQNVLLAGRTVSALAGSLSILLVYLIAGRLYSELSGLCAAALIAFSPLHITCSRYMKGDSLFVFFLLLTVFTVVRAVQEDKKNLVLLSGLFAGFCASSKYTGALAVVVILSAPFLRSRSVLPDKNFITPVIFALFFMGGGFLCGTPYALLSSEKFLSGVEYEGRHLMGGHHGVAITALSQYCMYHFSRSVVPGMTALVAYVAVAGAGVLLRRAKAEDIFLLVLLALFYGIAEWAKSKPAPQAERYILPAVPFLAISAAEFCRLLWNARKRALALLLIVLMLISAASRSLTLAKELKPDTRETAARWIDTYLPHSSKILIEAGCSGPFLSPEKYEIRVIQEDHFISRLTLSALKSAEADYLVLSSFSYEHYFIQPNTNAQIRTRIKEIFAGVPVLAEFSALSGSYGFHNPRITVFSLKQDDFLQLEKEITEQKTGQRQKTFNQEGSRFPWW